MAVVSWSSNGRYHPEQE